MRSVTVASRHFYYVFNIIQLTKIFQTCIIFVNIKVNHQEILSYLVKRSKRLLIKLRYCEMKRG